MAEITNAKITSTMLGLEDHGIPTCFVNLEWPGAGQGFGGYDLRHYGIEFITKTCAAVGVEKWEDLRGKVCRIRHDHRKVYAIGHIVEDRWYEPEASR